MSNQKRKSIRLNQLPLSHQLNQQPIQNLINPITPRTIVLTQRRHIIHPHRDRKRLRHIDTKADDTIGSGNIRSGQRLG